MIEYITSALENYILWGAAATTLDTMSSQWLKGTFRKNKDDKKQYKSLELVLGVYKKENFEELKSDPVFAEAFADAQEYFRNRPTAATPAEDAKVEGKTAKALPARLKQDHFPNYNPLSPEFWAYAKAKTDDLAAKVKGFAREEKLNKLRPHQLALASIGTAFAVEIISTSYAMSNGTATFSNFVYEIGQTPFQAAGLLVGVYAGTKLISPGIKKLSTRYERKLGKIEMKIRKNEDLVKALSKEIKLPEVIVPPAPAPTEAAEPVPTEPGQQEKAQPEPDVPGKPAGEFIQGISDRHQSLIDRLNNIGGNTTKPSK